MNAMTALASFRSCRSGWGSRSACWRAGVCWRRRVRSQTWSFVAEAIDNGGVTVTQAGSHPNRYTAFSFNTVPNRFGEELPDEDPRDLKASLGGARGRSAHYAAVPDELVLDRRRSQLRS